MKNSDAAGLLYQWGRKDPFTFATKATGGGWVNGLNPLKIYNAQGKEIVQDIKGNTDTNGGTTIVTEPASSMLETIKKPNTFYAVTGAYKGVVVSQDGLTQAIWDYYWTSYSRGTDGAYKGEVNSNNSYLNGYKQQRTKSIYDPCPYGYRIPVNGTFNRFSNSHIPWTAYSYVGGTVYTSMAKQSWIAVLGSKNYRDGGFYQLGYNYGTYTSSLGQANSAYVFALSLLTMDPNDHSWGEGYGLPLRCIEDSIKESHSRVFYRNLICCL